jgi:RNA polymerase sigma-70 factor (ECF subfamily)
MEDSKILSLLRSRSESAINALARRFGLRLYRTAMNILGIREDAEESVNDTYLAVWNAIPPKEPALCLPALSTIPDCKNAAHMLYWAQELIT